MIVMTLYWYLEAFSRAPDNSTGVQVSPAYKRVVSEAGEETQDTFAIRPGGCCMGLVLSGTPPAGVIGTMIVMT